MESGAEIGASRPNHPRLPLLTPEAHAIRPSTRLPARAGWVGVPLLLLLISTDIRAQVTTPVLFGPAAKVRLLATVFSARSDSHESKPPPRAGRLSPLIPCGPATVPDFTPDGTWSWSRFRWRHEPPARALAPLRADAPPPRRTLDPFPRLDFEEGPSEGPDRLPSLPMDLDTDPPRSRIAWTPPSSADVDELLRLGLFDRATVRWIASAAPSIPQDLTPSWSW